MVAHVEVGGAVVVQVGRIEGAHVEAVGVELEAGFVGLKRRLVGVFIVQVAEVEAQVVVDGPVVAEHVVDLLAGAVVAAEVDAGAPEAGVGAAAVLQRGATLQGWVAKALRDAAKAIVADQRGVEVEAPVFIQGDGLRGGASS